MEQQCNYQAFGGMMPLCVLPAKHTGRHQDSYGGSYTSNGDDDLDDDLDADLDAHVDAGEDHNHYVSDMSNL